MTTDDGLKGLTDAQLVALYSELRHTSKEFCGLPHPMKNWTEEHDAAIANAARAWLAANVHDSGDSDAARYRFCRDNWSKLTTATLYGERGHYVEQIYLNTFGLPLLPESIDAAIDAAILAEKGSDNG